MINANYALQAGLNPAHDSIALEAKSSPFGNVVVVRDGDEAKPEFQKLKAAITSPEVKSLRCCCSSADLAEPLAFRCRRFSLGVPAAFV